MGRNPQVFASQAPGLARVRHRTLAIDRNDEPMRMFAFGARDRAMQEAAAAAAPQKKPQPWYLQLWFQVLIAMAIGVLLGQIFPDIGAEMQPLGDAFIKAIRVLIAPIIFCTVVHGIASMANMAKVGRVALKALIYSKCSLPLPW
jgi:Sodium:dicarboxylate symporter family